MISQKQNRTFSMIEQYKLEELAERLENLEKEFEMFSGVVLRALMQIVERFDAKSGIQKTPKDSCGDSRKNAVGSSAICDDLQTS
jgi:hypothetical protein